MKYTIEQKLKMAKEHIDKGIPLHELANIIDNKIEIKENSFYEVEIRGNTIKVIGLINQKTNNKYGMININDYLFSKKADKTLKFKPYHLTRNTNY